MNWMSIGIIALFVISIAIGIYRGALKIIVSLLSTIITVVAVFFATPYVSDFMCEKTPAREMVEHQVSRIIEEVSINFLQNEDGADGDLEGKQQRIESVLRAAGITPEILSGYGISIEDIAAGKVSDEELAQHGISRDLLDGLENETEVEPETLEDIEFTKEMEVELIEQSSIPQVLKNLLLENNVSSVYDKLGTESFIGYVSNYLTNFIINAIAFLFAFLIVIIIFRAVLFALNVIADLPAVGILNRLGGGILGGAGALITLWFVYLVITMLYATTIGKMMMETIQGNEILNLLYNANPLIVIISLI